MQPTFFATPSEFRDWLEGHHESRDELFVGFYKKGTGLASITWPEAVDEALCFGWIDGIRKSIDERSYMNRFTPRRPGSIWSAVNIRRAQELIEAGRMQPSGRAAFDRRKENRTRQYSFEQDDVSFGAELEARFRANPKAWAFFQAQPPGYRKTATWWVVSAKREATRERRLASLIADSAAGERVGPLRRADRSR